MACHYYNCPVFWISVQYSRNIIFVVRNRTIFLCLVLALSNWKPRKTGGREVKQMKLETARQYVADCCNKHCDVLATLKVHGSTYEISCPRCAHGIDFSTLSDKELASAVTLWNKHKEAGK